MPLDDSERHLVGPLCWRRRVAATPRHRRQRYRPGCHARRGYHYRRAGWELPGASGLTATAHHAARVARCSHPTAHAKSARFRPAAPALTAAEKRKLPGELELDEGYSGGERKGERGRGAAGKAAVFGIPGRPGKVFTVAAPNRAADTPMGKVGAATVERPVLYAGELTSYKDPAKYGDHVPVNHQEGFGIAAARSNGVEGLRGSAKRLYRHAHGVEPESFPPHLGEHAFRYNRRKDRLLPLTFGALVRPEIPE